MNLMEENEIRERQRMVERQQNPKPEVQGADSHWKLNGYEMHEIIHTQEREIELLKRDKLRLRMSLGELSQSLESHLKIIKSILEDERKRSVTT